MNSCASVATAEIWLEPPVSFISVPRVQEVRFGDHHRYGPAAPPDPGAFPTMTYPD